MTFTTCGMCHGSGRASASEPCPGCGGARVIAIPEESGVTLPPPSGSSAHEGGQCVRTESNWRCAE